MHLVATECSAEIAYQVRDIGIASRYASYAAINNKGQTLAWFYRDEANDLTAVRFDDGNTVYDDIPFYPIMNDAGQLISSAAVKNEMGQYVIRVWDHGAVRDVVNLGDETATVWSINSLGQFTATIGNDLKRRAVIGDLDGNLTDLGTLDGAYLSQMFINDRGEVGGLTYRIAVNEDGVEYADFAGGFYFQDGAIREIGTLGGYYTFPRDINNKGQLVGASSIVSVDLRAFVYSSDEGMRDLGMGSFGVATAINNHGVIVGQEDRTFITESGTYTSQAGFVYDPAYGKRWLEDLLPPNSSWRFLDLFDVNDADQIAAVVYRNDELPRAVILTPVPEPGTALLMTVGLAVIGTTCVWRGGRYRSLLAAIDQSLPIATVMRPFPRRWRQTVEKQRVMAAGRGANCLTDPGSPFIIEIVQPA